MFSKFARCYYWMCRDIFHWDKSSRLGCWQMIDLFSVFYLLRVIWVIHSMVTSYTKPYSLAMEPYDVYLHYFHLYASSYDPYLLTVILFFAIFYFVCEYLTFTLDAQHPTWRFWYQLVVENQNNYFDCKIKNKKILQRIYIRKERKYARKLGKWRILQLIPISVAKWLCFACGRIEVFLKMENIDQKELFTRRPILTCPNLSVKLRKIILISLLFFNAFFGLGQLVISFFFICIVTIGFYLYPAWSLHPWFTILWAIFDAVLTLNILLRIIRYATFFTLCTWMGTITLAGHSLQMRRKVEKIFVKSRKRRSLSPHWKGLLDHHLREHTLVTYYACFGSETLNGSVLYAFLYTNIPINVYLISRTVLGKQQGWFNLSIYWVISFVQLAALVAVFTPLAWTCSVFHAPKAFIPKLQIMTRGAYWVRTKLRYDHLYGRLLRGPKMGIFVGSVTAITYFSTMEFLFSYVGYLLLAMSQMISRNTQANSEK